MLVKAQYSTLQDEQETTSCFFDFQHTRLSPRKKVNPIVDRLVMGHAPRSESVKPVRSNGEFERKNSPMDGVFLR